jgi:hypothetical protein
MAHRWDGNEQRWGKRIRVNIPVQLSAEDATSTDGFMKNVSLSGALMKAETDLRLHSVVHVSIPLLSPRQGSALVVAHVSRKLKDDVGVEWCQFAPRIVKDLLRSPSIGLPT